MVAWHETSPADYDARLAARGHKRAADDQGSLFYVATPTRERRAAGPVQLPGQGDLLELFATDNE